MHINVIVRNKSLTIRLSDFELQRLEEDAEQAGFKTSTWARNRLLGMDSSPDLHEQQEGLERRVARLEEMAGL